jgi:hypothetical protein
MMTMQQRTLDIFESYITVTYGPTSIVERRVIIWDMPFFSILSVNIKDNINTQLERSGSGATHHFRQLIEPDVQY